MAITGLAQAESPTSLPEIRIDSRPIAPTSVLSTDPLQAIRLETRADGTFIDELQVYRLEEGAEYFAGVQPSDLQAGFNSAFMIRGFASSGETYINGHRDNPRYFIRDPATVNHYEFFRGHQSLRFGASNPGGLVNAVTWRGNDGTDSRLAASLGSDRLRRASLKLGGPLSSKQRLHGQLALASVRKETLYPFAPVARDSLYAALDWQASADSQWLLDLDLQHDASPFYFGTVYRDGEFLYDHAFVFANAAADKRHGRIALTQQQQLTADTRLQTRLQTATTHRDDQHAGFYFLLPSSGMLVPYYRAVSDQYRLWLAQLTLSHTRAAHTLELGVEQLRERAHVDDEKISRLNWYDYLIDPQAFDPFYDLSTLPLSDSHSLIQSTESALFLHDHYRPTGRWSFETGLRYSDFSQRSEYGAATPDRLDNHFWSGTAAATVQLDPQNSLYFNSSTSFQPNFGADAEGRVFDPKQAMQLELGWHHRADGRLPLLDAAVFCITQDNLLQRDPDNPGELITSGQRRSCGIEMQSRLKLGGQLSLEATAALLKAEIRDDSDPARVGNTPASAPAHSGSLRLIHQGPAQRSRVFIGIRAVSSRPGDDANSFNLPAYSLLDLGYSRDLGGAILGLQASNLLDRRYLTMATAADNVYQGARRALSILLQYPFR